MGVWLAAVIGWWIFSKVFRQADMDKLKNRLLGTAKTKKAKSGQPQAALINEDTRSGLLVSRVLKRFQLQTRLQDLLEQAGGEVDANRPAHTFRGPFLWRFT